MIVYQPLTTKLAAFVAENALPFRVAASASMRDLLFFANTANSMRTADMPGEDGVASCVDRLAMLELSANRNRLWNALATGGGLTINGKPLVGKVALICDAWQATPLAAHMAGGVVSSFDGFRLTTVALGYVAQTRKFSKDTVNSELTLIGRLAVPGGMSPLNVLIARVHDRGSDGASALADQMWNSAVQKAGSPLALQHVICAAHLADKALFWALMGGRKISAIVKLGNAAAAPPPAGGKPRAESLPERRGSDAYGMLTGVLYGTVTKIRSVPSAHKLLHEKSGLRIPTVVITRWCVYTILLARCVVLWAFIREMDAMTLGLIGKSSAEAATWAARRATIDANMTPICLALLAQRYVSTFIDVMSLQTQPTMPLVLPLLVWTFTGIRALLKTAITAGACKGSPTVLIDFELVSESKAPLMLLARFLVGL